MPLATSVPCFTSSVAPTSTDSVGSSGRYSNAPHCTTPSVSWSRSSRPAPPRGGRPSFIRRCLHVGWLTSVLLITRSATVAVSSVACVMSGRRAADASAIFVPYWRVHTETAQTSSPAVGYSVVREGVPPKGPGTGAERSIGLSTSTRSPNSSPPSRRHWSNGED
jgi:hypothetical protein